MKRLTLRLAFLPALALALSGCGLERIILLNPPTAVNAGGSLDGTFSFKATSVNIEPELRGFEVYYRMYLEGDSVPSSFESIEDMVNDKYLRLCDPAWKYAESPDYPLVPIESGDLGNPYNVIIDFSVPDSGIYPQLRTSGLTTNITIDAVRRYVNDSSSGECKRFLGSVFDADDVDLYSSSALYNVIIGSNDICLVMFAVSYGIDSSNGDILYSQPVWLGYEILTLKYN